MFKKICLLLLISLTSCGIFKPNIPQPKTEFRGVWIATVVNIDWPKDGSDPWKKQQEDYLKILNFYQDLNFNAVIVQIRTAGDAFYPSELAPWSRFLTGAEGVPPKAHNDPLKWMISEAHSRGFEFHAWLNPYRATFDLNLDILAETHDYYQHPEWMLKYGTKYYYNPGLPEVQQHLVDIMTEVVSKYDVDAIHFDDYFYPYKIQDEVFQDSLSYITHALPQQSLEDWRRSNVDSLVKNVHDAIKEIKPWVKFGISPFGVWKNNSTDPRGSDTKAGQTTYEDLYADPLIWMKQGWIDYLVPQVYWSMDLPVASHKKIVNWWASNTANTNLYIGNGAYKIRNNNDRAWKRKKEIPNQLILARNTEGILGNVFFSAKSLMQQNRDVANILKKRIYKHPALLPISEVFKKSKVPTPSLSNIVKNDNFLQFSFASAKIKNLPYALVYASRKEEQLNVRDMRYLIDKIYLYKRNAFTLGSNLIKNKKRLAITFVDNYGKETEPIILNLDQIDQYDQER